VQVGKQSRTPHARACRSRSRSADGQRIAFNAGSPTLSDIYLINSDGSGLTPLRAVAKPALFTSTSHRPRS
jgi:Tol biopolymer transport system component